MLNQGDAIRAVAAKYLRLAKDTKDPRERSKFIDRAMIYAQLSEQVERLLGLRDGVHAQLSEQAERRQTQGQ